MDITKCTSNECSQKEFCLRWTSMPNEHNQYYQPFLDGGRKNNLASLVEVFDTANQTKMFITPNCDYFLKIPKYG